MLKAIEKAGYKPGEDIYIALDAAASEFYEKKYYRFEGKKITSKDLIHYYKKLISKYPIMSIEDGLSENDWDGWQAMTVSLGDKVQLVGDDFFVTNVKRLQKGIEANTANSILIKVNQIGSLSETLDAINLAKANKYTSMISHRSGETEDTTIAHIGRRPRCPHRP